MKGAVWSSTVFVLSLLTTTTSPVVTSAVVGTYSEISAEQVDKSLFPSRQT